MAYVVADPEMMTAAGDLAAIGSNVNAAHMVAAARTASAIPAAADEVSTGIAQLFSAHAQDYQTLAGQAAAFHDQFVQHLTASAYASAEAANVSLLTADAAASISLLDPFIKFSIFASQLITLISENPAYFFGFVLPINLIFLSLGLLYLPYALLFAPFTLVDLLLLLSHATIGWP